MNKSILTLLLLPTISLAQSLCPKKEKAEIICTLTHKNETIELVKFKKGCEFPEGNIVDCAYIYNCEKDKPVRSGAILREGTSLNSFCITAKEYTVNGKKVMAKKVSQGRNENVAAYLLCPVKGNKPEIVLSNQTSKRCELEL